MKKDMITMIVGKIKKDKGLEKASDESESESMEDDSGYGTESAAESLIEAIHEEDTKGVIEALKSFIELCKE